MCDTLPNLLPVAGDCYEASYKNGCELELMKQIVEQKKEPQASEFAGLYKKFGLQNNIVIVHGWASSPGSADPEKRLHHAWIEIGDYVMETQGGMQKFYKKSEYYDLYTIFPNEIYTIEEAEKCLKEANKYDAWRGKGPDKEI